MTSLDRATTLSVSRILRWYRVVFVACIVALSVITIWRSVGAHTRAEHAHAVVVGGVELVMALLVLARRTQLLGVIGLLVVFAIAALISLLSGQLPFHLVIFAASALAIVQMDRALGRIDGDRLLPGCGRRMELRD